MKYKKPVETAIKVSSSKVLCILKKTNKQSHLYVGYIINQKYLVPLSGKMEKTTKFLRVPFPTVISMAPKRVWLFRI